MEAGGTGMSDGAPAPLWSNLFRPDPCLRIERWQRLGIGLAIWTSSLFGTWHYVSLTNASRM